MKLRNFGSSLGASESIIEIDRSNGSPDFLDAGRDDVVCKQHGGNDCYCVWWYYKHDVDRVCMDWKPYALEAYEAMEDGEECEIYKRFKCYCLKLSKGSDKSLYNIKDGSRRMAPGCTAES